jgi:hypothetical protein
MTQDAEYIILSVVYGESRVFIVMLSVVMLSREH